MDMKRFFCRYATLVLLAVGAIGARAEVGPADLKGEDREMFDKFRLLLNGDSPKEFYSFAASYEEDLKKKGYMMLYYKLKNNEGFYALRHNMVFRALQAAEELQADIKTNGATKYAYLATGLMGDIYAVTQSRAKAEHFFVQSLEEVGGADPKFTMRVYQSLAELLCLNNAEKAVEWARGAYDLAQATNNVEYQSLSLAIVAYVYFLEGNSVEFFNYYNQYVNLRSKELPTFSHRYDRVMEVAKRAFDRDFDAAVTTLGKGNVPVDSSLVALRLLTMQTGEERTFDAVKRLIVATDSVHSIIQEASFDQMAAERAQMKAKNERKTLWTLVAVMVGLLVVFVAGFLWERRRMLRQLGSAAAVANDEEETEQPSDSDDAFALRPVRVNAFCRHMLSKAKKQGGEGVELRFVTHVDDALETVLSREYVEKSLTQMVGRALRYTKAGGYVLVRCQQEDGRLMLTVSSSDSAVEQSISCGG